MSNKVWSFVIGCCVTAAVAGFSAYYLHFKKNKHLVLHADPFMESVESLDYRFNDFKYSFLKTRATSAPVVLLAVDDESVQEIGRWPWSRDLISQLLEELLKYQVSSVGLDMIFSEPEKAYPENDKRLAQLVEANSSKIILGTYSDNKMMIQPYQDYCVTEAFLASGGDQIVKVNAKLVVDDEGDTYDDIKWNQLFPSLFEAVSQNVTASYIADNKKNSIDELNGFQKNHLNALIKKGMFQYCSDWLTANDALFDNNRELLLPLYTELFNEKSVELKDNTLAKLEHFKKSAKPHPTPQFGEWVPNILEIQTPAAMTGSFVTNQDVDGLIRRYPLFFRSGNRVGSSYIPSLALNMYLASNNYRALAEVQSVGGNREIKAFKIFDGTDGLIQELPTDAQGRMLIHYYGPKQILPYVSAKELLNDVPTVTVFTREMVAGRKEVILKKEIVDKKEFFKNRAVLFGATSMGIYDLRSTPVDTNYPGPEVHLTMLANLFDQKYIRNIANEQVVLPLTLCLLGFGLSLILMQLGAVASMVSFAVFLIAGAALDFYLFSKMQIVYSGVFVFALFGILHSAAIVYKYLSEEKKKQALKKTFSKYVSPAVVDEILKAEENLKLGGKKQEMTVFFSDVRGFTKFSETMDPEELTQFLNEYLTPMTEVIFNNKGTLDKYMGDGLMAFFGAPISYKDHAYSACKAALESLDKLKILKEEFKKKNWPDIDIGIGINSGMMSVGNMGSQIVQSYTVIGDAVNLGARLEGTTKQYGARILVSEATYLATKESFLFREVDRVRVMGKKEPVGAFELLGDHKSASRANYVDAYNEAYSYYVQRNFVKSLQLFSQLEKEQPLDLLIRIYKKRCEEFLREPPAEDWDGVHEMKSK